MSWGLKGILVLQDLACARVYARIKVWILDDLDGWFNAELYSSWMPAWIMVYQLRMPCNQNYTCYICANPTTGKLHLIVMAPERLC
jgi:hypothetical protein